ncbi:MAG: histidine phosphatase family protein [Acidimicrobiia bacterium]
MKPDIWLVRHGQTEWSASGRHTSRTDVPLTADGRAAAVALAPRLAVHEFSLVLSSPATRALDTARLAGFADAEVDADLHERDYGDIEGATTDEIRARGGEWSDWSVWTGAVPGGETLAEVGTRASRVLARADAAAGDVLLFGHGHQLRILAAVALELAPGVGARLVLDPATVSIVGHEHELRAIRAWNRD